MVALVGGEPRIIASFWAFPVGSAVPNPLFSCSPAAAPLARSHSQMLSWPVVATSPKFPRGPRLASVFPFLKCTWEQELSAGINSAHDFLDSLSACFLLGAPEF